MENKKQAIEFAKNYLRGEDISNSIHFDDLYSKLIQYEQFGYATEILLEKIADSEADGVEIKLSNYQDLAENIYKDTTLSSYFKFEKAINVLKSFCDLEHSKNCKTLSLAGEVYKHKWKFDHQFHNLLQSRAYYKKGYLIWKSKSHKSIHAETDCINTAVNYAHLNELIVIENLERLSETSEITSETLKRYELAQDIRREIIHAYVNDTGTGKPLFRAEIEAKEKLYPALAEAFFGLRKYKEALHFIMLHTADKKEAWQIKSFSKQIYNLSYYQRIEKNQLATNIDPFQEKEIIEEELNRCLMALNPRFDEKSSTAHSKQKKHSKVGLGLSGGGFRAALFHIGVLAALADKGKLKDIEVISCVSGGSIIGAFYYLKIKQLYENKADKDIIHDDYIKLVKEIEKEFLEAVQKNIRMRLLTSFSKNIEMMKEGSYSRSYRLGELYEQYFYKPLMAKNLKLKNTDSIYMSDLFITPFNNDKFDFKNDNWKRANKVPQLILNATSVNSGHNWQFTASWMGEPPTYISNDFDVKPRFRRMYYDNAPDEYKKFSLGYAVAASSCVPVLFEPLVLKGLYKNYDLELIDGGVHDNQGVASILEQECNEIIISDGSAQMQNNAKNTANPLSLFFRVDTILQERLREIQLLDLKARKYTSIVNKLIIVHLKNGLSQLPVSWVDCTDVNRSLLYDKEIEDENSLLKYGLMTKIQKGLSEVRTDLDSFNDIEAYALMYSGYQQVMHDHSEVDLKRTNWKFLKVAESCTLPAKEKQLVKQLKVSCFVPFKIIRLSKTFNYFVLGLGNILLIYMLFVLIVNWNNATPIWQFAISYNLIGIMLLVFLVVFLSKFLAKVINIENIIKKKIVLFLVLTFGWLFSHVYILLINPLYNKLGKIK